MNTRPIHVAIVEDEPEIRRLLSLVIDNSPGFACQLVFSSAEEALKELKTYEPDVLLMDIQLPGMSGIEAVKELYRQQADFPILMLTVQEDDDSIFDSLCAGACGYLTKETPPAELLEAIREAQSGGSPMTSRIARRVVASFRLNTDHSLSKREQEVLKMLCNGDNYRSIADALFVSTNTIKAHIKNIYKKLHVHTRAEAVQRAIRDRLV